MSGIPSHDGTVGKTVGGVGEELGGRIRIEVCGGRVSSVELDPRVHNLAPTELAQHVRRAANTALSGQRTAAAGTAPREGSFSDGEVYVSVADGAGVESVGVSRRVLAGPSRSLAARLRLAINAALDDAGAEMTA